MAWQKPTNSELPEARISPGTARESASIGVHRGFAWVRQQAHVAALLLSWTLRVALLVAVFLAVVCFAYSVSSIGTRGQCLRRTTFHDHRAPFLYVDSSPDWSSPSPSRLRLLRSVEAPPPGPTPAPKAARETEEPEAQTGPRLTRPSDQRTRAAGRTAN